jgi:ubiquinone/menaquinone biosynthesis C-methylase UbiE
MYLNLGCNGDIRKGFVNLDKATGWRFEDGLPQYPDGSVQGITISHALQNVALEDWPRVLAEFYRVLAPGGVVRITDDDTESPSSSRYGRVWGPGLTPTGPWMTERFLQGAGFRTRICGAHDSILPTLIIAHRENRPEGPFTYFVEGVKDDRG